MQFRPIVLTPWQRDLAVVVLPAVTLLACAFAPKLLTDSDTYWHLATGRWILEHGRPPTTDPFSFTAAGRPWVAHEWLSEVILAGAYALGRLPGVMLVCAGAMAAAIAIIAVRIRRRLGPLATLLVLGAVVALLSPSMLARPHLLVLPILAAWTAELLEARAQNRTPGWWLLPVMTLWANMHGSYIFGLVLLGPFALEALVAAEPARRVRTVLTWGAFGLAAVAAAAITPHGLHGLIFPWQLMSLQTIGVINEWKAVDFSKVRPFEVVLLAAIFAGLWRGVRVPALRLALLIFLLHMALAHLRHGMVLAVVGALVLAEPLAAAYPPAAGAVAPLPPGRRRGLLAVAAAMILAVAVLRLAVAVPPLDSRNTPATAMAHVPAELRSRPVFNEYGFGGLLIFEGVRPFIDGRADMYGDAHVRRYLQIAWGDRAAFDQAVRQYGIAWTILSPSGTLLRALQKDAGWRQIYADRYAVVLVRADVASR